MNIIKLIEDSGSVLGEGMIETVSNVVPATTGIVGGIGADILINGAITFISQKALKCLGKKDYADIISMTGWCLIGGSFVKFVLELSNAIVNSKIVQGTSKAIDGVGNLFETIGKFAKVIEKVVK